MEVSRPIQSFTALLPQTIMAVVLSITRAWSCVVVRGRSSVVVRGRVWSCVVGRGRAWSVERGRAWSCMVVRGRAWSGVVVRARACSCVVVRILDRPVHDALLSGRRCGDAMDDEAMRWTMRRCDGR